MRKSRLIILSLILALVPTLSYAETDDFIFTDPIANTFTGRIEAAEMIENLTFRDLPNTFWAMDAIVRGGALNLVKGYSEWFNPNIILSNEDALAFLVRARGMEAQAHEAALRLRAVLPAGLPTLSLWTMGYLDQAMGLGLITQDQFYDSLRPDQHLLDPAYNFIRGAPVTREQVADWIHRTFQGANIAARTQQSIYQFADWHDIEASKISAVETMVAAGIMNGDQNMFRPQSHLTRAEMAQILKNMDYLYYEFIGVQKKTGTVGGIRDAQSVSTGTAALNRDVYIRTADGQVDVLQYGFVETSSPMSGSTDAVVLRDGFVGGLASLREGDEVEYLVRADDNIVLYVQVTNAHYVNIKTVRGRFQSLDLENGVITILDVQDKAFNYTMIANLYGEEDGEPFLRFEREKRSPDDLPIGTRIELSLKNNIVDGIGFLGEPVLTAEMFATVLENNTAMGLITVINHDRETQVMRYYYEDVNVKRKAHYHDQDRIGYIDAIFQNHKFNPVDASIASVSPGDLVSLRTNPDDGVTLTDIYAYEDYHAVFGKIREFHRQGQFSNMLIEYEDGQVSWFTVPDNIFISKGGNSINHTEIIPGDWVRILVSSLITEPGRVIESVKEMSVESGSHKISRIVMGKLGGVDELQDRLILQNTRTLSKTGWVNARQVEYFNLAGSDTEFFLENERISADYAKRHLKRASGQVYIALENNYTGERAKKVTFRNGRDELLDPDVVLGADGSGRFYISGNRAFIYADRGAIVRRLGRLTDAQNILPSDFAVVNLNGEDTAAVVDIIPRPDTSGVIIARGRILTVNEGRNFRVESKSLLNGNQWSYTPVQRLYAIDGETLFVTSSGIDPNYPFRGYTENSVIGRVFNIVLDGARAARVVDAPFCTRAIRGVIFATEGSGRVRIRDTAIYENDTGIWRLTSNVNATMDIHIPPNSIVVKNNTVIESGFLQPGDHIHILTNHIEPGSSEQATRGYIITVER